MMFEPVSRWRRVVQWLANRLQPRIAQQLLEERDDIHDARQRVHVLGILVDLAKMRKFPQESRQQ